LVTLTTMNELKITSSLLDTALHSEIDHQINMGVP
jgi:hypothetical protein